MSARLTILGLTAAGLVAASMLGEPWSMGPIPSAAQEPSRDALPGRAIEQVWVGRPTWRRGSGLLYGAMTFTNANPYPVWKVIMACDFFDEWGNPIGTKATGIHRVFGPGRTRVRGIYFTAMARNTGAGACRVISAQPWWGPNGPTS